MEENKERALEELRKLEPYRLEILKKIKKQAIIINMVTISITIPCLIAGFYLDYIAYPNNVLINILKAIGFCVLFSIFSIVYYESSNGIEDKKLKSKLKRKVLPLILSDFGDIKHIEHERKNKIISKSQIEECGLFNYTDNELIDDVFSGFHNDIPFKISEIDLYRTVYYGHCYYRCYHSFRGVLLSLKLSKNRDRTLITTAEDIQDENKNLAIQLGLILFILAIYNYVAHFAYESVEEAVKSLSISLLIAIVLASYVLIKHYVSKKKGVKKPKNEFVIQGNRTGCNFYVYSDNLEESTQITTPEFLIELLELQKKLKGENIRCSIYENNLMVAVDTEKDLFELGSLDKPLGDPNLIDDFYAELNAIYDFMDYIKNNEDLN